MIQTGARFGMQLMADAVRALVEAGAGHAAEARRALWQLDSEVDGAPHETLPAGAPRLGPPLGRVAPRGGALPIVDDSYGF